MKIDFPIKIKKWGSDGRPRRTVGPGHPHVFNFYWKIDFPFYYFFYFLICLLKVDGHFILNIILNLIFKTSRGGAPHPRTPPGLKWGPRGPKGN